MNETNPLSSPPNKDESLAGSSQQQLQSIPKILVVDDDQDIVHLLNQAFRREIEKNMFSFVFKFSSEEAFDYLNSIDDTALILILSDINMPGKNGLILLKEIKEANNKTPVFLYTAYDDNEKRKLAAEFKADKYILKPIDFGALREAIYTLVKK